MTIQMNPTEKWNIDEKIDYAKRIISQSDNIVCLSGVGVVMECGALNFNRDDVAYRIEEEYGRCPEEIMASVFYNVRMKQFYDFYKKELLSLKLEPSATYEALHKLQETGKLKACITYNIYGLAGQMGIDHVYELDGSIHNNWCSKCGKTFSMEYLRDSEGVPLCDSCKGAIRPGIRLHGERMRNNLLTKAANACAEADVLLVLGTNLFDDMVQFAVNHYQGDKLILVTAHDHFTDKAADLVIHEYVKDILPKIVP
ncbi:MAG: NAD-dependent deacetylase [Lachnospiraceae bacterium]|nr:NAD-dependent deacetylase [Lachnospiraceae bacterium]